MPERLSALSELPTTSRANAAVTVREIRPGSILQVSSWPDTLKIVETVISELLGVQVPPVGSAVADPNLSVLAVAPGRFLLSGMAPDLAPRFEAAIPSADGAVINLAHGRTILRLEGEAAALWSRCVAIDLDPSVFPPGRIAQTMIHHIDVVLHRQKRTTFDLWVSRSFAEALAEWLLDAGLEIGTAFERH
jgi:heterotetrameric sarcosine oxidase gamma subunit